MDSVTHIIDRYQAIIPDVEALRQIAAEPLPMCGWANTLKITLPELQQSLAQDQFMLEPLSWHAQGFRCQAPASLGLRWEYQAGLLQIQEEVSMLPVVLLDPQPGERVLDMCAAPGNKTAQVAVAMNNTGTLIANDRNYGRMRALGQIMKRLGLINISTTIYDAVRYPKLDNYFDKILVDAPCSCEGTFRKNRNKVMIPNEQNSITLAKVQSAILAKALRLCKPGGKIIYSTCTFAPEENEAVISRLLAEQGDGVRVLPIELANFVWSEGIAQWQGEDFHPAVKNTMRVWPDQNNTGGFFVAVLEKSSKPAADDVVSIAALDASDQSSEGYLEEQCERFGFERRLLQDYHFTQKTSRGIYCVNQDNQPPDVLRIDATGMFFLKTRIKHPKLSTAAAMLFGRYATKNKLSLDKEQRQAYFQQQDCVLRQEQITQCTSTGYVMVCYQNQVIGMGLYFSETADHGPMLRSLFPKYLQ